MSDGLLHIVFEGGDSGRKVSFYALTVALPASESMVFPSFISPVDCNPPGKIYNTSSLVP